MVLQLTEHQIQAQIHKPLCIVSFVLEAQFPVPRVMLSLRNAGWKVLLELQSCGLLAGMKSDAELNNMLSSRAKFVPGETQRNMSV